VNFPWVRHYQRYEYLVNMGYITNAVVADVGCSYFPLGAYAMATFAKTVFAIDPYAKPIKGVSACSNVECFGIFIVDNEKVIIVPESIFDFVGKVNVAVACEVFEHMPDPGKFIKHLSRMCEYAFITTPLVSETRKTRNPEHVAEYSAKDFDGIVGEGFDVESKVYQTGDMQILDRIECRDCDSFCLGHIDQMVWARSKHATK